MPILDKNNAAKVAEYTEYMENSPWANATQDLAWSKVKADWADEQVYIERDGKIVAAMSLLIRKVFGKASMIYATRGPICDFADTALVQELVKEVDAVAKKHHAFMFRMDPELSRNAELEAAYAKLGYLVRNEQCDKFELIQPRYNMILNIGGYTWEELMTHFSEKTRYNIRLSARKGVTVRWSRDEADLRTFYELYKITAVRDKIGYRPYEYFERMMKAYKPEQCRVYIAEHEGEALSGAICINYGKKTWYIYGASSNEKRNLMPNYAMQAEMIKWGLENGSEIYDFGGVFILDKSNGLFKFKEGFCRQEGATEFIGEFDKVYNRFFYTGFNKVIPQIQRLRGKTTKAKEQKIEAEQRRLKEEADRERAAAKEQK